MHLPRLNATETGRLWISQFAIQDRLKAAALLDEMLLLNDQEVTGSLLWLLGEYVPNAGPSERVALYAEREFGGERPFVVACVPDETGRVRRRAIGRNGPAPVKPLRGSSRVGSEGMVAFVISQAVKSWPKVFLNHP